MHLTLEAQTIISEDMQQIFDPVVKEITTHLAKQKIMPSGDSRLREVTVRLPKGRLGYFKS
jgi:hypothetical protein